MLPAVASQRAARWNRYAADVSGCVCWVPSPSARGAPQPLATKGYPASPNGLTHHHHAHEHADVLRLVKLYGTMGTTWGGVGLEERFEGEVIGQRVALGCSQAIESRSSTDRP